jgi:hypothetical protein
MSDDAARIGNELPLDTSEKSATLNCVDEIAAPDQPPSTSGSVAFADVWRPVGNLPLPTPSILPPPFHFLPQIPESFPVACGSTPLH